MTYPRMATVLAGAALLAPALLAAPVGPAPSVALLALSKADQTLAIVDPTSLAVVARIPTGPDPHEVIASDDGTTAYVSNYGGGTYNTLGVIDLVAEKALPSIDLGPLRGPHGLAFAGGEVWFTAEVAKAIGRVDPSSRKIDFILGTGQNRTHMIHVSSDLGRIVTSNVNSATISIFEKTAGGGRGPAPRAGMPPPPGAAGPGRGRGGPPSVDWNETVVPVGRGVEGFDVSPNGREIWAANAQDGTISIIGVAIKQVVRTLAAHLDSANRLKFTPDGSRVLVSMLGTGDVAVFDAATRREIKRISVGKGAAGILMQPDGARAFVGCSPDNYVAVIDLTTLAVAGHIDVGGNPDGLAWAVRR